MNKTKITPGNYSIFIHPEVETRLENGPIIRSEFQIIVYQDKGEWKADIEMLDVREIVFMGATITKDEDIRKFMKHFKDMGIDLWGAVHNDFQEIFDMSSSVEQFVFEQTGIRLS